MSLRKRKIAIFTSCLLIAAGMLYGATRKPHIPIPSITNVKWVAFEPGRPILHAPGPIINRPKNQAEIDKLYGWLANAKAVRFEQPNVLVTTFGPPGVEFVFNDHTMVDVSLDYAPGNTITEPNGHVIATPAVPSSYVDVSSSDSPDRVVRCYAPQLANWLNAGWKKDFHWKAPRPALAP